MEIFPVIDLLRGQVVRGVAGDRRSYAPIQSRLCDDASPAGVARAFATAGFRRAYVADLDAIEGRQPDWQAYRAILETGMQLWLDPGLGSPKAIDGFLGSAARELPDSVSQLEGIIVGLESLDRADQLRPAVETLGNRAVFSLDMKHGRLLTRIARWQNVPPMEVARQAVEAGFLRLIVLDLARVGRKQGLSVESLCREIKDCWPPVQLVSGGGVRNQDDLQRLAHAGCSAALVASALHEGKL